MSFTGIEDYLCSCYRRAAAVDSDQTRRELRDVIKTLVAIEREAGSPPEKVVRQVKELLETERPRGDSSRTSAELALAGHVITWTIEEYFREV